jgi:hypothetical protein
MAEAYASVIVLPDPIRMGHQMRQGMGVSNRFCTSGLYEHRIWCAAKTRMHPTHTEPGIA